MSNLNSAQEEFDRLVANKSGNIGAHPEDREDAAKEAGDGSEDEETQFRSKKIDAAMGLVTLDCRGGALQLPPVSFDADHSTGVKGVIADARAYESARRSKWKDRVRAARRSVFGQDAKLDGSGSEGSAVDPDEEDFLTQWRESRKLELEAEARLPVVRTRRTSPSVRLFSRLDKVDALGYLDAIEKVGRETVVVVFVYDHECPVSATVENALQDLVSQYPNIHFVKVHYEDVEFDPAAVPAILAYRNQGELFANLTGLIEELPGDRDFDNDSLKQVFRKHDII